MSAAPIATVAALASRITVASAPSARNTTPIIRATAMMISTPAYGAELNVKAATAIVAAGDR